MKNFSLLVKTCAFKHEMFLSFKLVVFSLRISADKGVMRQALTYGAGGM